MAIDYSSRDSSIKKLKVGVDVVLNCAFGTAFNQIEFWRKVEEMTAHLKVKQNANNN